MAQSLSPKVFPPKGGNALPKYLGCAFTFNKHKNRKRKYKHKKKHSCYTYFHLPQLGVEYSSNNAGDGPDYLMNYLKIFYDIKEIELEIHTVRMSLVKQDLFHVLRVPVTSRLPYYIILRNISYEHNINGTLFDDIFMNIAQNFQDHLINSAYLTVELDRALSRYTTWKDLIKEKNRRNNMKYKAFINPDMTIQLGVAYSSNDAGDGPVMYVLILLFTAIPALSGEVLLYQNYQALGFAYLLRNLETYNQIKIDRLYKKSRMEIYFTTDFIKYLCKFELILCLFIEFCLYMLSSYNQQFVIELFFAFRICLIYYGRSIMYRLIIGKFVQFDQQANLDRFKRVVRRVDCKEERKKTSKEDVKYDNYDTQMFSTINAMSDRDKKFYEALIWYAASLKRCKSITDVFFASSGFYQMISEESIYSQIANSDFIDYFVNLFGEEPLDVHSNPQTQSYEELKNFRMFLGNYDKIKESEVYCKIKRFIIYTLCKISHLDVGINFQSCGYTKLEEVAMRRKYSSNVDFIYIMLDTISFLGEKGYEVYRTGKFDSILHNSNDYSVWYDKVYELKKVLRDIDQNPEFIESSFLADLNETLEKGRAIKRFSKNFSKNERIYFLQIFTELEMMEIDYNTKRRAREPRKVPFSLLVEGDSGIGKTTILDILCVYFAQINGLRTCPTYRYTKNAFAEFWDNFSTYMHTIILDDIAFMKPDATQGGDPSCMEFLQIINAVPYVPNQAALENKGKTPLKAELVIGTTNTRHLNAHYYFSCPSAAQRRFPFIVTATVKPQYRHDNCMTLDSTKVPMAAMGDFPDYWTWSVATVKPVSGDAVDRKRKLGQETLILDNANLQTFLEWYRDAITAHNASQEIMLRSLHRLQEVSLCHCGLPFSMCTCSTQSFTENIEEIKYTFKLWSFLIMIFGSIIMFKDMIFERIATVMINCSHDFIQTRISFYWLRYIQPRVFMEHLGRRAATILRRPKKLLLFVTIATTCLIFYKMYNGYAVAQSFTENTGKECSTQNEDDREDIWYKSDYNLSTFDMQPANLSSKGMERAEFQKLINKNVIRLNVQAGNTLYSNNAFCIYGHIYAINRHFLDNTLNYLFEIVQSADTNGINGNVKTCLTKSDVLYLGSKNDLAFVQILCLPPKKDLRKYLIRDSFYAKAPGFILTRNMKGQIINNTFKGCEFIEGISFPKLNIDLHHGIEAKCHTMTQYGDCGAPMILSSELGYVIAGIHSILADGKAVSLRFTQSEIEKCLEKFPNSISEGYPRLEAQTAKFELGDLSRKSVVRFAEQGTAYVYGSTSKFRTKPKTRVEPTVMSEEFQNLGFRPHVTKPVMAGWEPWRIGLMEMVKCDSPIRTDILDKVKNTFIQSILKEADLIQLKEQIHVLTDFETINGAPGVKYIDKINRNTSTGPPWNKSKKYVMYPVEPHGLTLDPVDLNEEVKERIKEAMDCYLSDSRYHFMYKAHLKDEPISFSKAEKKKTRIFCGASVDNTFIVRKFYLSVVRYMQNNRYLFENAPGINVDSIEWDDLYHYLTEFGTDCIIAGDFSAYDKTMKAVFLHAAFDVLDALITISDNYSQEDYKILYGIREDLIYSTTDFNGDLIEFFGKNPSGNALTVILNGLVNCLYNRYAYYLLNPDSECDSFKENVRLMVYGDDNIIGVNNDKIPWFNHTALVFAYEKMGIKYTMAEKEAKSVPYIKITEATFLKRYFRFDDTLCCQMAPIEFQSIADSLTMWVRSKSITREQQMLEIMSGALLKFFHYGEKTYERWRKEFRNIIDNSDLKHFEIEAHVKTYAEMVESFQDRRKKLTPFLSYQPLEE